MIRKVEFTQLMLEMCFHEIFYLSFIQTRQTALYLNIKKIFLKDFYYRVETEAILV